MRWYLVYQEVFQLVNSRKRPNLVPFRDLINVYSMGLRAMLIQVAINVIMFAPFGFLLPLAFSRLQSLKKTFVISLISAISIEVLQYFYGRSADVDDVIMNVIGACIGYILFISYIKIGKMIKTRKVHSAMLE